jgi:hypothetical protein
MLTKTLARLAFFSSKAVAAPFATVAARRPALRLSELREPAAEDNAAMVIAMLSRHEAASGPQIAEATGWAPHTVLGFLADLARKGIKVEVLERVR